MWCLFELFRYDFCPFQGQATCGVLVVWGIIVFLSRVVVLWRFCLISYACILPDFLWPCIKYIYSIQDLKNSGHGNTQL